MQYALCTVHHYRYVPRFSHLCGADLASGLTGGRDGGLGGGHCGLGGEDCRPGKSRHYGHGHCHHHHDQDDLGGLADAA